MGLEVIVPAPLAGRLAGLYSVRKTGYVRRSARVLGALGSSVEGLAPEPGWSVRGTSEDTLFRGDVGRQLVVKMEAPAALRQPPPGPAQEPRVVGKGRERVARRAVQQAVEEAEAAARALKGAEPWGRWDNPPVGVSMVQ